MRYQCASKQNERHDPAFKANEILGISVNLSNMQDKILPLEQMSVHLSRMKDKVLLLKQMR